MAEQQKQQGKHHPAAPDAPTGDVAQTNAPVEEVHVLQTPQVVDVDERAAASLRHPLTPVMRAKRMVRDSLGLFDADEQSISKQVVQHVTAMIADCPKEDLAAFRTEGKMRAERLKQFSEMLFNEFIYQTATLK